MNRIFLTLILLLKITFVFCQEPKELSQPKLELVNGLLLISYNFPEEIDGLYIVSIESRNSKGDILNVSNITGDIGRGVKAGMGKRIIWDIYSDNPGFDDELSVRIFANSELRSYKKSGLLVRSVLWPGLGQTKISDKNFYWLTGLASYGCAAGAIILNLEASKSYDLYINADDKENVDKYFNNSSNQDRLSKILGWSAVGVWSVNIIWMSVMPDKRKIPGDNNKVNMAFNPYLWEGHNTALISLTVNF